MTKKKSKQEIIIQKIEDMEKEARPFYRPEGMTKEEELFDENFTDKLLHE